MHSGMRSPVVSTVTPADLRHTQIGFAFEENVSATTFFGRREKRARPHFSDEAASIHRQLLRSATSGFRQGRMKAAGALIAGPARSDHANPAPLSPRRSGRTAMIAFENFCLQPSTHYVQQASKAKKPTKATATDKKKTKVRLHDARDVTVSFFDFHRRRRTFPPRRLRRGQRIGCHRATDEAPTAAVRSINGFRREQETHLGSSVREAECPLWDRRRCGFRRPAPPRLAEGAVASHVRFTPKSGHLHTR